MAIPLHACLRTTRAVLFFATVTVAFVFTLVTASPSHAYYERDFCYQVYMVSGGGCIDTDNPYHNLAKVEGYVSSGANYRICANGYKYPGTVSGWNCDYRSTVKYLQGMEALGYLHNGDPAGFTGRGVIKF
jgi:hypothetical protein